MEYLIHKYTIQENGTPFDVERPDRCNTERVAKETFKEAFRHHMGRKPTASQIHRAVAGEIVIAKSGNFEMHFAITGRD